jgi:hypothetical protein
VSYEPRRQLVAYGKPLLLEAWVAKALGQWRGRHRQGPDRSIRYLTSTSVRACPWGPEASQPRCQ